MRTFKDWPPALRQQPSDLSDAGFYYIGEKECQNSENTYDYESIIRIGFVPWFVYCTFGYSSQSHCHRTVFQLS